MTNLEKFWPIRNSMKEFRKWCARHRKLDRSGNIACSCECLACMNKWLFREAGDESEVK